MKKGSERSWSLFWNVVRLQEPGSCRLHWVDKILFRSCLTQLLMPEGDSTWTGQVSVLRVEYFLSQSVGYLIYSYYDGAGYHPDKYSHRLNFSDKGYFGWVKKVTLYTFAFQNRLGELSRSYQKIFDNGEIFVLDLNKKIAMVTSMYWWQKHKKKPKGLW